MIWIMLTFTVKTLIKVGKGGPGLLVMLDGWGSICEA
jgi:hypothetical protein